MDEQPWPNDIIQIKPLWCFIAGILLFGQGCNPATSSEVNTLFQLLSSEQTGIDFQNIIVADDSLNLLDYEYLYNGGGVGTGDFNNDGLPDLVFTGNQVKSRIFLNLGNLKFEDVTETTGFDTGGKWSTGVSIVDINNDGFDDIYLSVGGQGNQSTYPNLLFINQKDMTFRESAKSYGLGDPSESNHAVFLDYDRDGDLDMYLLNGGGFEKSAVTIKPILNDGRSRNTDRLYENTYSEPLGHPVFEDVSKRAGINYEGFGLSVGVLDANGDNWPDIYISNDYLSKDLLYLNKQDGTFREQANQYFNHTSHFSMGNSVGDLNNDGYFDLLTLDMLPEDHFRRMTMFGPNQPERFQRAVIYGYGYQYMRNMLQLGNGLGNFQEVGQLAGIDRTDWSWCPLIADLDNDGLQDIYITNGYGKNITDLDFVKFRQGTVDPFSRPEEARKLLRESVEQLPPIVLANYAYQNKGETIFQNTTANWGFTAPSISTGAIYVDLDLDGDLEVVTNNINAQAFVYKNQFRETSPAATHFLGVSLQGPKNNPQGVGSRIIAYAGSKQQHRQQQPVGGYQSSGTDIIHFGFGKDTLVDSVLVVWPDGRQTLMKELNTDQIVKLEYRQATQPVNANLKTKEGLLAKTVSLPYTHQEVVAPSDFDNQPLLLHNFTNQGPGIAVGDVNNDGLDDIFLGTGYGSPASLLMQKVDGQFSSSTVPTEDYEDLGAIFVDVDGDNDLDLYVASGGTERYLNHPKYQDRIFLNNGQGAFELRSGLLPEMLTSTATVAGGDFNQDGTTDLFVGGRVTPGNYPLTPRSYLLANTGGQYEDVTEQICPDLSAVGMVTSAIWTDFNNDNLPDLILVGEMMKITAFANDGFRLVDVSDQMGLTYSAGKWNSIISCDIDNDGDTDYVVGNIGENNAYRVSPEHPLKLHFGDFDNNGTVDPIFSAYEAEAYYPVAALDMLAAQLPKLKKEFLHYNRYANSTTQDILQQLDTTRMQTLYCHLSSSIILENLNGKKFNIKLLPKAAQIAPVKGIIAEDINLDGYTDLILVGNEYHREVTNGNLDASTGLLLLNNGGRNFSAISPAESGLFTTGDTRAAAKVSRGKAPDLIVVTKNKDQVESYELSNEHRGIKQTFRLDEVSAILHFEDGKTAKVDYPIGGGYLSQSSRTIRIPQAVTAIVFKNSAGRATREISLSPKAKNI